MKKILILTITTIALIAAFTIYQTTQNNLSSQGEVTIEHSLGSTTLDKNPETIVVFDYGVLETLDYLNIDVHAVPKSSLPQHLTHFNNNTVIDAGTLFEPDFEALYRLNPDLIIISGRQSDLYEELSAMAPTIFMGLDNTEFYNSMIHNLSIIDTIFDIDQSIDNVIASLDEQISTIQDIAENRDEKALILLVNSNNISALGIGSRFDVMHSLFNVKPADEDIEVSNHGQNVTFEYISHVNPDIIYVIDRGLITEGSSQAAQLLDNDLVNSTNAYKNNKIIHLDAEAWYISNGGIVSFETMINDALSAFQ